MRAAHPPQPRIDILPRQSFPFFRFMALYDALSVLRLLSSFAPFRSFCVPFRYEFTHELGFDNGAHIQRHGALILLFFCYDVFHAKGVGPGSSASPSMPF